MIDKDIVDGFSILHIAPNDSLSSNEPFEKLSLLRLVPLKLVINSSDIATRDFISALICYKHH